MTFPKSIRSLMIAAALVIPVAAVAVPQAHAGVFIQVGFAPPLLPVYAQPVCPGDGYLWTPGYWAYGPDGYYWVPGVWVYPPEVGLLWTPAWWGWEDGFYRFHRGYWGRHVGFYGGINYGFGYGGFGFDGGYWDHGAFFYNRRAGNFYGAHVTNVYERNVTVVNRGNVSFNGGQGGINARPRPEELSAEREHHFEPTGEQSQHETFASQNHAQFASFNHGHPGVVAAGTTSEFRAGPHNLVNDREANQQQRISNGVRDGQMTSGEAGRADQRQANIDTQVHNERVQNGGTLTNQERNQINNEQNGASRQIYNENHNGNTQFHTQPPPQPAAPRSTPPPPPPPPPPHNNPPPPPRNGGGNNGGNNGGGQHERH
jgi:hypothetical protein